MIRRQTKNNPLMNRHALLQLNPYAKVEKKRATNAQNKRIKAKAQLLAKQAEVCGFCNLMSHGYARRSWLAVELLLPVLPQVLILNS